MPKLEKVYFANRSTPQIVKKGERAKPKDGYGKQTARKPLTESEEKTVKRGGWIRTREDGKEPTDPAAKKSKYRPKQAAKQRAGDKRRAAAASAKKTARKTTRTSTAKKPAATKTTAKKTTAKKTTAKKR